MAKLGALPAQSIIDGFKGSIDFYFNMGIPCARRWPRSPGHRRAPAVEAQWSPWAYISRLWNSLTPEVQESWRHLSAGTHYSGRDLFTKAYLKGIFKSP